MNVVGGGVAESTLIGSILTDSPKTTPNVAPTAIWGSSYPNGGASSISRPTSAPPLQEHVNGTSIFNNLSPLEVSPEDPRLRPEYSNYYHENRNLNPRLPPPLTSSNRGVYENPSMDLSYIGGKALDGDGISPRAQADGAVFGGGVLDAAAGSPRASEASTGFPARIGLGEPLGRSNRANPSIFDPISSDFQRSPVSTVPNQSSYGSMGSSFFAPGTENAISVSNYEEDGMRNMGPSGGNTSRRHADRGYSGYGGGDINAVADAMGNLNINSGEGSGFDGSFDYPLPPPSS